VQNHRDSFVRHCVKEFSLENYIAIMCIAAYRRSPSWKRLQTFYVTFLKGTELPMEINVSKQNSALACSLAQSGPTASRGFLGRTVMSNAPANALNDLIAPILANLSDTYSRYQFTGLDSAWRYGDNKVNQFFHVQSDKFKQLKKTTTDDQGIVKGVNILIGGGFPMTHMGLTGVVKGL
jgi:hypothetical protein